MAFKPISDIPGYEKYVKYELSNTGVLRNKNTKRELKWFLTGAPKDKPELGYLQAQVCCSRTERKGIKQHIAIAKLFIDNPDDKSQVDHINGVRSDNCLEKLRWATAAENARNRSIRSDSMTGHKNITKIFDKKRQTWFWRIHVWDSKKGKSHTRGFIVVNDETEPPQHVINIRDEMLRKYFKEFTPER